MSYFYLLFFQGSEQTNDNHNIENNEENESKETEEIDKVAESKLEERMEIGKSVPDENMEAGESTLEENTETETNHASQNVDSSGNENVLEKYWHQRYRLFHRFDEGIQLDEGNQGILIFVSYLNCIKCYIC